MTSFLDIFDDKNANCKHTLSAASNGDNCLAIKAHLPWRSLPQKMLATVTVSVLHCFPWRWDTNNIYPICVA
jgi:hypothetical protein